MNNLTQWIETVSAGNANGAICNDRGNGSGGPRWVALDDCAGIEVTEVTRTDDPDAWTLALGAAADLGLDPVSRVAVGPRSESGHQSVFAI